MHDKGERPTRALGLNAAAGIAALARRLAERRRPRQRQNVEIEFARRVLALVLRRRGASRHGGQRKAEKTGGRVGRLIRDAVMRTNGHSGGNTHFGAFILLVPLVLGGDIEGARRVIAGTDVQDAVDFYAAFALTSVRVLKSDELDVNDPASVAAIRERGMTLADIMAHSAPRDMVAREWTNGFALTRRCADLLHAHRCGRKAIVAAFMEILASEPDTFIAKKHGMAAAERTMRQAAEVLAGSRDLAAQINSQIARAIGNEVTTIIASARNVAPITAAGGPRIATGIAAPTPSAVPIAFWRIPPRGLRDRTTR